MGSLMEARRRILLSSPHLETIQNADIASFSTDMRSPLRALTLGIDPVQDLHGYDSPWPAGGGKNKWHLYANGYYNSAGGFTPSGSNGCSDKIQVTVGATYVFGSTKATTETLTLRGYFFDENDAIVGSQIAGSSGSKSVSFTAPSGAVTVALWFSESGWTDTMIQTECDRLGMQMETGSSLTTYAPYSNICPISGWTEANVWRTGKNLLKLVESEMISSGWNRVFPISLKAGKYILSCQHQFGASTKGASVNLTDENDTTIIAPLTSGYIFGDTSFVGVTCTITAAQAKKIKNIRFACRAGGATFNDIAQGNIQLELGSTATPYEPYSGNQYTIQLGDTVYGGTLDVLSGVLRVDRAEVDLGTLDWTYDSLRQYFRTSGFAGIITRKQYSAIICDQYATKAGVGQPNADCQIAQNSSGGLSTDIVNIKDARYTDADTFTDELDGVKAVYELATPLEYTLTPQQLDTLAGQNVMWGDSGKIELLKYWTHK